MIELFPNPYNGFACPNCDNKVDAPKRIIFQGIHLIADLHCGHCNLDFYHDFPTGHGMVYPVAVDKNKLTIIYPQGKEWFTIPLVKSLQEPADKNVRIDKLINKASQSKEAILFNCLDAWYGHVLLKLLNIQFYNTQFPLLKKIVLIPKGFEWLIPDYANEIWTANLKLSETINYFPKLDEFIHSELSNNYQKVYYSSGYSHPPLHIIDPKAFFKTSPFNTEEFEQKQTQITFIYREDRLWLTPFANRIFNFLKKRKSILKNIFLKWQISKINRLARNIKKECPDASLYVCGIGAFGKFNNSIIDQRETQITTEKELKWCGTYSNSHVVVGIHGSNMLIPSALACTWVEILPDDRIGNITQDLFCKHTYNSMPFMGRFVSEYDPIKRVSKIITGIIRDYTSFKAHQVHNYSVQNGNSQ